MLQSTCHKYPLLLFGCLIFTVTSRVIEEVERDDEFDRHRRAILKEHDFQWKFPIPYYISLGVNENNVKQAIKFITTQTCIRFRRNMELTNATGLNFVADQGCFSFVGRVEEDTTQEVAVGDGCSSVGWIQHMIAHSLGLLHEETRPDREKYVKILLHNVHKHKKEDFEINKKHEVLTYNLKYDYGGLMHSNKTAKSAKGKNTIEPHNKNFQHSIGRQINLSFNEIKTLNMYYCNKKCPKFLKCDNRGYINPNNCAVCKCPTNYSGFACHLISKSSPGCPRTYIRATKQPKIIVIRGKKNCFHQIKTTQGFKIKMVLLKANLPKVPFCTPNDGLEIKFFKDKTVSGNHFCGIKSDIVVKSVGYHVSFHYHGTKPHHFIKLQHKRVPF